MSRQAMSCRYNQCLAVITGACSATSLVCLCVGLATDSWLYAAERVTLDDSSGGLNASYRNTTSGLWRKCVDDPRKNPRRNCSYTADSFSRSDDDDLGPTDSILLSLRWVVLFPLGSLLILLVADAIAIVGHWTATRVLNFLSGILSVIGGLVTLVGIVVYVSAVTGEAADNKPKPTAMDEPKFLYRYGPSFFITVASFVGAEITGVLSVHVYIHRYKQAYHKHHDIQQPTIIDGSVPRPVPSASLSTTPLSSRYHHDHHTLPLRRSSAAAAPSGALMYASRWSNGHRAVGIPTLSSSSTAALHAPSSSGNLLVGCPTDDDCSETYSPLSESFYAGPVVQLSGGAAAGSTVALNHQQSSQLTLPRHLDYQQHAHSENEMSEYNAFTPSTPTYQRSNYGVQSSSHHPNSGTEDQSQVNAAASHGPTAQLRPEQQSLLAEAYRRTTPV